ncbi:MAG: serine/threonine protein kinase [Theionarchaea archaeon]|nr:serine/threonine protein kinase [Theionarchaea archaeon]MBU7037810.1 serine/threonine protein kinase [Theionarchaea archaeon]
MAPDIYSILNYPHRERNELLEHALADLGITLHPFGSNVVWGVPILGKGWSSIVVYGIQEQREVAIKIQRKDSHRLSLGREALFLRIVNDKGIGPTLYHEGKDFLVLEYIKGVPIRDALVQVEHLRSFLEQCYTLDLLNVDHGQIQGGKHLVVGEKCWIIDFEKAGFRTPRNVSSLVSEVFLRKTECASRIRSQVPIPPESLIEIIRNYKKTKDLTWLLDALRLT